MKMSKVEYFHKSFVLILLFSIFRLGKLDTEIIGGGDQFRGFSGRAKPHLPVNLSEIPDTPVDKANDISRCLSNPTCSDFFEQRFPTVNGNCNNRVNTKRGSVERSFKRIIYADYEDGREELRLAYDGGPLPSARAISNALQGSLNTSTPSTQMVPFWGQFLVHDIALTLEPENGTVTCTCGEDTNPDCVNIPIPRGDPQFQGGIKPCFLVMRSEGARESDGCSANVRQQVNELSAYMDLGIIYGNSEEHLNAIKDESGGLIDVQPPFPGFGKLLPPTDFSSSIAPAAREISCPTMVRRPPNVTCRVSGERRTNENSVLLSQHTIWMRTHNIVFKELKRMNPRWTPEMLLQTAKLIVTSLHQRVTFEHFLPVIVGDGMMTSLRLSLLQKGFWYGYDSSYDATVSNSFTTAAFRMGHTLINQMFNRPDPSWTKEQAEGIRVKTSLFNVGAVTQEKGSGGPNSFIRGLANYSALTFDSTFSDDLRNFLDAPNFNASAFGFDLLARNLQRGRDHGLPPYIQYRIFCGLSEPSDFSDLSDTMNRNAIKKLQAAYKDVRDIDLFAGGISEISVEGGTVGPTFACIIGYQFRDLKKGDRFWHENAPPIGPFNQAQLAAIRAIKFSQLLCEMVDDMKSIQPWPMRKLSPDNERKLCKSYPRLDFSAWKERGPSSFTQQIQQDVEKTAWFPMDIKQSEKKFTSSDLYLYLLTNRPTEVCRQVLDTETRMVHERTQVRYHCLPGTITYTDFPPVLSDKYFFTSWYHGDRRVDGYEVIPLHQDCESPYAIQVQTYDGVPGSETGDVFDHLGPFDGLLCFDDDQESGRCHEYQARLLCRY